MKFQMYGREFKTLIDRIGGIVPKRTALPVLQTVKITAHGNTVDFQATDMCDYATIKAYANVFEDGETWVCLSDLKKVLGITDDITITSNDGKLDVRGAKKSYEIPCHDDYNEQWVEFPNVDNNNIHCRLKDNELLKHLSNLNCMRSEAQANQMMTAFYLDLPNEKIVTLDGYRIGIAKLHGMFTSIRRPLIIGGSLYNSIKSLVGKNKDENFVEIYADKKYARFDGHDYVYITRMMDGQYFDYKKLTEPSRDGYQYTYKFNPSELSKIAKEYSKVVKADEKKPMIICNENGKIATGIAVSDYRTSDIIESVHPEYGMDAEWYSGFNPRFIVDACAMFDDEAKMCGNYSSRNPIMIIGETYECLILPVNTSECEIDFVRKQVA